GHTVLDPNFLSPPSAIIQAMPRVLSDPGVQTALQASFIELVIAFVLAVAAGVVIGLPIGLSGFARRATLPLVLLLYAIPQVTILPLFVLYFGIGAGSKIAFGVSHGIFPIILNVVAGVQSVEAAHLTAARSLGATSPAGSRSRPGPRASPPGAGWRCREPYWPSFWPSSMSRPEASAITPACSPTASIRRRPSPSSPCWR